MTEIGEEEEEEGERGEGNKGISTLVVKGRINYESEIRV